MANTVTFEVACRRFTVPISDLRLSRNPEALLTRAVMTATNNADPIVIDANADLFPHILDIHRIPTPTGGRKICISPAVSKSDVIHEAQRFGLLVSAEDVIHEDGQLGELSKGHDTPKQPDQPASSAASTAPTTASTTASPVKTTLFAQDAVHLSCVPGEAACAILSASSWSNRAALMGLNRHWRDDIMGNDNSWKAMCNFLHREEYIYSAPVCSSSSWHTLFGELWPLRSRWSKSQAAAGDKVVYSVAEKLRRERAGETGITVEAAWKKPIEAYSFNMNVVVRLKPQREGDEAGSVADAKDVVLPLHQRIAFIRQQKGCSKEEAFVELFGATNGDMFDGAALQDANGPDGAEEGTAQLAAESTKATESEEKTDMVKSAVDAGIVSVGPKEIVMCAPGIGLRPFTCFDSVLCDATSQAVVFETVARHQVADFVNGLNCTIFCYGQTGSGKTHTLFGKDADTATKLVSISADSGLVPRACAEIVAAVEQRQKFMEECKLQLSYVEVFGEEVSNLLKDVQKSVGWKGTQVRAVLDGNMRVTVENMEHMELLLQQGEAAKRHAATAMNSRSSRAHTLLILTLTQTAGSMEAVSNLCLADLGGSEQLTKSGATGERMQEAIGINKGLLALKQTIRALNNKDNHIPYHDSKLTELLSSGLGGNSKTTVVVTASPEPRHAAESMQALRFGEACAVVTNVANAQMSSVAHLIAELNAKIASTEALIEKNERWERREEQMPVDEFGDGGGIRTRMKLVGAEKERVLLEGYLRKRRALLGEPEPDEKELAEKKMDAEAKATAKPDFELPVKVATEFVVSESAPLPAGVGVVTNFFKNAPAVTDVAEEESREKSLMDKNVKETLEDSEKARLGKEREENAPTVTDVAEEESREESLMDKNVKETLEDSEKARLEKEREERLALAGAKAAEREARAAKRKEELLAAKSEKARKTTERIARQQESRRAKNQGASDLEAVLSSVEAELTVTIASRGIESEHSIALVAKAEDIRQQIKAHQVEKARTDKSVAAEIFSRKNLLPAEDGQAVQTDGWQADMAAAAAAAPVLSTEEQELIAEHRQARLIVSHQATDWH